MSLLDSAMTPCIMYNKQVVMDGYGGYKTTWTEGVQFDAAIVYDGSSEALIAQSMGETSLYTVTTRKGLNLQYHDVIKRLSDGKVFRITTDGDDNTTPPTAYLNMRQVKAEEWELT